MGYRRNDDTEFMEAKILFKAPKSYMIEATLGGKYFLPFSQIVGYPDLPEADEDGNRNFEVTAWWFGVKEEIEDR